MTETLTMIIISTLATLNIITLFWVTTIHKRLKKLTAGKNAASLEEIIKTNNAILGALKKTTNEQDLTIENLQKKIQNSIQNIKIERFDALKDGGGQQSFAIGLTDENKNGVVISSMYTRDRMNVFAKSIVKGTSKHTLTEEEKIVIN